MTTEIEGKAALKALKQGVNLSHITQEAGVVPKEAQNDNDLGGVRIW